MITKFFIGIKLTAELKSAIGSSAYPPLIHVPWKDKEFLGLYLEDPLPTLKDVHHHFQRLQDALRELAPDQRMEKFSPIIFPQVFLG